MHSSVEDLAQQAIALSAADRARLADLLLASLPDEAGAEASAAWDDEIRRRVEAVDAGTARLIDADEVHAAARQLIGR